MTIVWFDAAATVLDWAFVLSPQRRGPLCWPGCVWTYRKARIKTDPAAEPLCMTMLLGDPGLMGFKLLACRVSRFEVQGRILRALGLREIYRFQGSSLSQQGVFAQAGHRADVVRSLLAGRRRKDKERDCGDFATT